MKAVFDHETLDVCQEAISCASWAGEQLEGFPKSFAAHNQRDRASASIPLNIAEGNGKNTAARRCRFFDSARGSALEAAACLDVLAPRGQLDEVEAGTNRLVRIVSMLVGLIRTTSPSRVHEGVGEYGASEE